MEKSIDSYKIDKTSQFYTFMVVAVMVLDVYTMPLLPFLSWGEFIFICLTPYFLSKTKELQFIKGAMLWLFAFCLYGLSCSIVGMLLISNSTRDIFVRVVRESFYYILIFGIGVKLFNFDYFKKILSKLVITLAVFVLLQTLVFYITGYLIPGLIPNVEINDGGITGQQMYQIILKNAGYMGYIKPNGFLCEPAHCAHCFFVCLIILLFEEKTFSRNQQIIRAGIVSLAMVATMSTSAFIELAFVWIAWLIVGKRKGILQILLVIFAMIVAYVFVFKKGDSTYSAVFERFTRMFTGGQTTAYSGNVRVLKGFEVFESLPLFHKAFGIGFGAYDAAVNVGIIHLQGYDLTNDYMNTISYLLVSSGLVGFILYLGYFISIFRSRSLTGKLLIVGMAIMAMGSGIYCTPIYIWLMLVIYYSERLEVW